MSHQTAPKAGQLPETLNSPGLVAEIQRAFCKLFSALLALLRQKAYKPDFVTPPWVLGLTHKRDHATHRFKPLVFVKASPR